MHESERLIGGFLRRSGSLTLGLGKSECSLLGTGLGSSSLSGCSGGALRLGCESLFLCGKFRISSRRLITRDKRALLLGRKTLDLRGKFRLGLCGLLCRFRLLGLGLSEWVTVIGCCFKAGSQGMHILCCVFCSRL